MNRRKLLRRLSQGSTRNIRFADMRDLLEAFGFHLDRIRGSHHLFSHPDLPGLINLQEVRGEAKPYQIRQFLKVVERYNIKMEGEG